MSKIFSFVKQYPVQLAFMVLFLPVMLVGVAFELLRGFFGIGRGICNDVMSELF